MDYIHTHWISLYFKQEYVGYVKFAFKSMDTVHMGHVVHVSMVLVFCYQSSTGLQS